MENGSIDEFWIDMGEHFSESEKEQIKKTLSFFIEYKESGLAPIAEHIDMINKLSNRPTIMVCDEKIIRFHELREVV